MMGEKATTTGEGAASSAAHYRLYATTLVVAAILGFAAVYVTLGRADNVRPSLQPVATGERIQVAQAPGAPAALPSGPGANPLSVGQMAAFVFRKVPEALPEVTFLDGTGQERTLKDWRGKVVLLNLWATWCAPCRKEMPSLERLNKELGSDKFEVVAVSADKSGIDGARKFLDQLKIERLGIFADPTIRIHSALKAIGMPATILIDAEGREIGRLVGPAEWDSAEAKRLIRAVLR
jgi:thiol-disulfide isomerase/thioredoxin